MFYYKIQINKDEVIHELQKTMFVDVDYLKKSNIIPYLMGEFQYQMIRNNNNIDGIEWHDIDLNEYATEKCDEDMCYHILLSIKNRYEYKNRGDNYE